MSLADDVLVSIVLGDYIAIDAGGKLNILGGGFNLTAVQATGTTAPMFVAVMMDVPSRHLGHEFAMLLELRDTDSDTVVTIPGPLGNPEALRIQQLVKADRPNIPGVYLPESITGRAQALVGFATGIPLSPGHTYAWRVDVDGQHLPAWTAKFHVLGPPPAPVFGGPVNSPSSDMPPL
jgi:hypothetical protein